MPLSEWCYLAQLKSKEIIALCNNGENSAVKYNDGSYLASDDQDIEFETIKQFYFEASSIAVTNDNNILVCVNCDGKKVSGDLMYNVPLTIPQ